MVAAVRLASALTRTGDALSAGLLEPMKAMVIAAR